MTLGHAGAATTPATKGGRLRVIAVLTGAILAFWLLCARGVDVIVGLLITAVWALGLAVGGRILLWISFRGVLARRTGTLDSRPLWSGAMIGGLAACGVVGFLLGWSLSSVIAVFAAPWAMTYAIAKVGCYTWRCCGWTRRVPLQLVEASFAAFLSVCLLIAGRSAHARFLDLAFLVGLAGCRAAASFLRRDRGHDRCFAAARTRLELASTLSYAAFRLLLVPCG